MNWFVWRQHRKQFLIFCILLAAFAALLIPTGIHFWYVYQHALLTCNQTASCNDLQDSLFQGDVAITDAVIFGGFALPALLGLFLGSPLIGREYEEGTNKLVWMQSVSRRRWLTTKLVWALVFAALYGVALTLLTTWWSRTSNALNQNRFDPGEFAIQGLAPVAYSLFFTAVGFTLGAWFRKTLLALAVTIGLFVAFQTSFVLYFRPHFSSPATFNAPIGSGQSATNFPAGSPWVLSKRLADKSGHEFDSFTPANMPVKCSKLIQQAKASDTGITDSVDNCLNSLGYHIVVKYYPSDRYWDFQRIEVGIYLGMTAVAVAATYWLVLKRDA